MPASLLIYRRGFDDFFRLRVRMIVTMAPLLRFGDAVRGISGPMTFELDEASHAARHADYREEYHRGAAPARGVAHRHAIAEMARHGRDYIYAILRHSRMTIAPLTE